MLAYILFFAHDAREQEMLTSPEIGRFAFEHCKSVIERVDGLDYGGLLTGHIYPFMDGLDRSEFTISTLGERCWEAREQHHPVSGDAADRWRVLLRPLQGRLSLARVREFCGHLAALDRTHGTGHAVSVAPFTPLSHPAWNTIATEHHRRDGQVVRIPRPGTFEMRKDQLFAHCEDQALSKGLSGSQELMDLYYDDNALCAFRGAWEPGPQEHQAQPVLVGREAYTEDLPLFFQLPIFEMSASFAINCDSLNKLVGRNP